MIWLLIILVIFLIPLPLSITFIYENNKLSVFIYKFKIYPTKNVKKTIKKPRRGTLYPKMLYFKILQYIYQKSGHFLFKSSLDFKLHINYGLDDAYYTAILYGLIEGITNSTYYLFSKIFKIKNFDININPEFNRSIFQLKVKSIIFINLAKIIYMSSLIYISFKKGSKQYLRPKEVI